MKILETKIKGMKTSGEKGLSLFLTGGWPTMERFTGLLEFIDRAGLADFIEIGIPFSDPLADGPVIQKASSEALRSGVTPGSILETIGSLKGRISTPLVLMTYLNVLLAGGIGKNIEAASAAGFQALIVPDLPAGESKDVPQAARRFGMGTVFLAAPTTSADRLQTIVRKSSPFLYYVSSFGVTGVRGQLHPALKEKLAEALSVSEKAVYCGFGISTPEQARSVCEYADGVIIGSALTRVIAASRPGDFKPVEKFAINIRKEIKKIR